jgi:hypothetical protein
VGGQYLLLAGAVHTRQRLRELRAWIAASAYALRRRVQLMRRAIARQGLVRWIIVHLKELTLLLACVGGFDSGWD